MGLRVPLGTFHRALFARANLLMGGNEEVTDAAKVRGLVLQDNMTAQNLLHTPNRKRAIFDILRDIMYIPRD